MSVRSHKRAPFDHSSTTHPIRWGMSHSSMRSVDSAKPSSCASHFLFVLPVRRGAYSASLLSQPRSPLGHTTILHTCLSRTCRPRPRVKAQQGRPAAQLHLHPRHNAAVPVFLQLARTARRTLRVSHGQVQAGLPLSRPSTPQPIWALLVRSDQHKHSNS